MKKLSLFLILCFLSISVQANVYEHKATLETISKKIPQMENIKCKFKQEKTLQNIQKPVLSSGDFEFKKNEGVYFYTTYPIKSNVSYSGKNYKQINNVVSAISNKNFSKLEKEFDFYFEESDSQWRLGLKPKDKELSNYLSQITVEGENYIRKINIVQKNGNQTTIWFSKEDL